MKIWTKHILALEAPERWKEVYFRDGKWGMTLTGDTEIVYKNLLAVRGNSDAVDKVIGNNGWTKMKCDICHSSHVEKVVELDNNEDSFIEVCNFCIEKILKQMNAVKA
jgi:hypothetical protein